MKRTAVIILAAIAAFAAGCGSKTQSGESASAQNVQVVSSDAASENSEPKGIPEDVRKAAGEYVTADGGSTDSEQTSSLKLKAGGSFTAQYNNRQTDDFGEYADGIVYTQNYSGTFSDFKQVDRYTYSFDLSSLELEKDIDSEWTTNDTHYIASDPYDFEKDETFYLYLPGKSTADLPEELLALAPISEDASSDTLKGYVICTADGNAVFFSEDFFAQTEEEVSADAEEETAEEETEASDASMIFADSSTRTLTQEDVSGLSADQLSLAINELYARHGYAFTNQDILAYFEQYDWYSPTTSNAEQAAAEFNDVEKANMQLLTSTRNSLTGASETTDTNSEDSTSSEDTTQTGGTDGSTATDSSTGTAQ